MALLTFVPSLAPSPGTKVATQAKIHKTEFGDGYTQRTAAGINHMQRSVDLKWEILTKVQADQIIAFLEGQQGYKPFYYKPHNYPQTLKWVCESWTDQIRDDGFRSISCTLEQSRTLET